MLYKPELSHLSTFPNRPSEKLYTGHSSGNLLTAEKRNPFLPDFKNSLPIPGTNDIFLPHCKRAVSSVVEHMLHTHGVTGSKPVPRTIS